MLYNFFCDQVQTVKIVNCYFVEAEEKHFEPIQMFNLELIMKNGSTQYIECEPRHAFKKYKDILDNPIDKNYNHNGEFCKTPPNCLINN